MKGMRKSLLLALAIAAMGALAAPAAASANQWLKEGSNVGEPTYIDLEGQIHVPSKSFGKFTCSIDGEAVLDAQGQGQISEFDLFECSWASDLYGYCPASNVSPTTLPWSFDATGQGTAIIDDMIFTMKLAAPCEEAFTQPVTVDMPVTALGNPENTTAFEFHGLADGEWFNMYVWGELTTSQEIGMS